MLQNIQRVEFAPVEDLPLAVAEVDPLAAPEPAALEEPELVALEAPVASTDLAELYRQQELEVPIIAPRDGPIAALDPDTIGVLARRAAPAEASFIGPMPVGRVGRGARGARRRPRRRGAGRRARRRGVVGPAAADRGGARRLGPGLPGERHGALRAHPREGRNLRPARGRRRAAGLGGQLRIGLRPGRRHPARTARPRHPRHQGRPPRAGLALRTLPGGRGRARGDLPVRSACPPPARNPPSPSSSARSALRSTAEARGDEVLLRRILAARRRLDVLRPWRRPGAALRTISASAPPASTLATKAPPGLEHVHRELGRRLDEGA